MFPFFIKDKSKKERIVQKAPGLAGGFLLLRRNRWILGIAFPDSKAIVIRAYTILTLEKRIKVLRVFKPYHSGNGLDVAGGTQQ